MHFNSFGEWKQCLKDYDSEIGGCGWYDEHRYRDGAIIWNYICNLVEWWIDKCFDTTMKAKSLNG